MASMRESEGFVPMQVPASVRRIVRQAAAELDMPMWEWVARAVQRTWALQCENNATVMAGETTNADE